MTVLTVEDIWDSIATDQAALPLTDEQKAVEKKNIPSQIQPTPIMKYLVTSHE